MSILNITPFLQLNFYFLYLIPNTNLKLFIMRKLLLTIALVSFCFSANAQFGASVGYGSGKAKVSGGGESVTSDASGAFAIGLFYDSEISDNLDLLPSIAFGIGEKVEDESNNSLALGLGLQYYPSGKDGNFFIQPGLGLGFTLADVDTDFVKKSAFSGSIGLGIDLSDNFTLIASYATQLSNSSNIDDITIKANSFGGSLLYKF